MTDGALIPLLVLCGPTASGKTALGVRLAERLGGEVVSADSMQVYRGADIATAKPAKEEMRGIPHHLIDVVERDAAFSAADYAALAHAAIAGIAARGRLPILVGGTGLYIKAVVENMQFCEQDSGEAVQLRQHYQALAAERGNAWLWGLLRECDPERAALIHENNVGRVARALCVYALTGHSITEQDAQSKTVPSPYRALTLVMGYRDRAALYGRIDERVDGMLRDGLLDEARAAERSGQSTAAQAIGHKELRAYLDGQCELADAVELLKQQTRRYAKRQITWFKSIENAHTLWCDGHTTEQLCDDAIGLIEGAGSLV